MTACGAFTFEAEGRANPFAVTRRFWHVVWRWGTSHWRCRMANSNGSHYRLSNHWFWRSRRCNHWSLGHRFFNHWRFNDRSWRNRRFNHRSGCNDWLDGDRSFNVGFYNLCFRFDSFNGLLWRFNRSWSFYLSDWRSLFNNSSDRLCSHFWRNDFRWLYWRFNGYRLGGNNRCNSLLNVLNRDWLFNHFLLNRRINNCLIMHWCNRIADPHFTGSHFWRRTGDGQRHRRLGRITLITVTTTTLAAYAQMARRTT